MNFKDLIMDTVNLSYLEVPMNEGDKKLKDNMHITALPLYQNRELEFNKLHRMFKSDYRQISPFKYLLGKKISDQWNNERQNLIILDVDEGLSISEAKEKFKMYQYFIYTTKSHQVEKKGKKCDRFRVVLVSDNIPRGEAYFEFTKELEKYFTFIDKQVNNKTGAFLGNFNCEYWYNDGKMFDCSLFMKMAAYRKQSEIKKPAPKQNIVIKSDLPLDEIKNRLNRETVADIISSLGYDVNRKFMFKYRQDERTASASIKDGTNPLIKDWGADLETDAIGFIQIVKQRSFKEAVDYAGSFVNVQVA